MPLARGLAGAACRADLVTSGNLNAQGMETRPMRSYRLSAAVLALVGVVGCGSDNGGGGPSNPAPVAKFSIACTLLDCTFTDASTDDGSVASYAWTFGDPAAGTSTVKSPVYTYAAAGSYHVKLTVTDDKGLASAVADSTISVSDVPGQHQSDRRFHLQLHRTRLHLHRRER